MRLATLALAAAVLASAVPRLAHARSPDAASRGPYSVELLDESGVALPTYGHRGRTYVLGTLGRRYLVRVRNASPRRAEVVVSVDGRDVIDGRPAAFGKSGYVVEAWGEVLIDGYRLSEAAVAAFRFGTVPRSYSARMGDARDVGVIGVAVFPERERPRPPPYVPYSPPYDPYTPDDAPRSSADAQRHSGAAPEARSEATPGEALAGKGSAPGKARSDAERPGLGTEFGEQRESHVVEVQFERARSRPDAVLALRYDDRDGLLALGIDVDGRGNGWRDEAWLRDNANPFRGSAFAAPPPGWR